MSLDAEWQTFLTVLIAAAIPAVPLAFGLIVTWLKVKNNQLVLNDQPTKDEVSMLIDRKLDNLPNGVKNGSGSKGTDI